MNQYIKGEGPYIAEQWEGRNEFVVVGPGWETVVGTYTKNESDIAARFANLAYAEGRKAERERCLEIVGRHPGKCDETTPFDCLQEIKYEIGGKDAK